MVLGFMVFWPLGLAMLAYILFGERFGHFKREANSRVDGMFSRCRRASNGSQFRHNTGNVAFDDWRKAEFDRIEAERRKLDEMREEFDSYLRELRRAKDQEEFDRFMRDRATKRNEVQDFDGGTAPA
ncbi:hypothetical protein J2Z17_003288 [Rhizobium halophytocola]|uniref:DUF2852 domain-containing protein n=2 Tax=Rhizobium halophytocola TaxID=735519 RepID=A0ABS4E1P6_9HYPH|nr:hypothetical protein [Rhizobium halophytocola]